METLHVTVKYESDEGDYGHTVEFKLTKTFEFKKLPCSTDVEILLKDDAIDRVYFKNVTYDPDEDIYYVRCKSHEKVHRYYHGDASTIMSKVVARYEKHGWKSKRVS